MDQNHKTFYHPGRVVNDHLDGYTMYFSEDSSVATKVEETIDMLPQESAFEFFNFCVFAAVYGDRHMLHQYLTNADCSSLSNFILQHWLNRNSIINMSTLTLADHCIMAATGPCSPNITIMAFRSRIGANNIWDANLRTANLTPERKRIIQEKRDQHGKREAVAAGKRMFAALARRQRQQETQTSRRYHPSRRGRVRFYNRLLPDVPPKLKQGWTANYDQSKEVKEPAQTESNNRRESTGRIYYYCNHAIWYLVLSLMVSMPWIAVISISWDSTPAGPPAG